ncbi:MAG: EAL domain-containing protein [Azoarcus sp.]|nr:EAL domain-containing protein [Azoarcus sp.]
MHGPILTALLYNAALLLAMVLVFELATSRYRLDASRGTQVLTGGVLGLIAIGVMMAPFDFAPGIVFDTRSVILAMSGLFFGALPTIVAAAIAATYRFALGGGGAWTGVFVIVASGLIGYLWRARRAGSLADMRGREFYALGLAVHAVMIALMMTLPAGVGAGVIAAIGAPVMIVHPLATAALGILLANRLRRDRSERELERSEALYRSLVDSLPQNIFRYDREGRLTFANRVFQQTIGRSEAELIGISVYSLAPPDLAQHYRSIDAEVLASGEPVSLTGSHPSTRTGELVHVEIVKSAIRAPDGTIEGIQCAVTDVTERRQAEARVHRLAYYDTLTGLPNRSLLMDRLAQNLAAQRRAPAIEALILLNIDRFKIVNDARGYRVGDALLKAFAERLQDLLRTGDTLARMTGDEFAILLPDVSGKADRASRRALSVGEKIHAELRRPLLIEGEDFSVTVSIGITLFPDDSGDDSPEAVLRRADTALHRAKAGAEQTAFFDTVMGESATQSFRVERDLRHALAHDELCLHLQSLIHPERGPIGAEVLVRWKHPVFGLLYPNAFVPIAEESSLIVELGSWVLNEACALIAIEARSGRELRLSINISPRQFRQRDFVVQFKALLAESGADPHRLTLEITESLFLHEIDEIAARMNELAALGVRFSIDDFGTGYSSLAYLKRLPIHELKIDKSFIQDAPDDPNDAALVETILSVARHLQLDVVAEGVETEEQAAFLSRRASVVHQGYLYGRPEPAERWLGRWRQN